MNIFSGFIVAFILFVSFQQKSEKIVRMYQSSFTAKVATIDTIKLNLQDTISNKTIKIYMNDKGYPIKYSRDIVTGVCIDGKCRLVAINLFWNVTGRYLGFELPEGEYLSKTEHDPFNNAEYQRLHEILSEDNSPLASYSMSELVPESDTMRLDVDAISSATIEEILDDIVEGAVYTTYTLWHIVYGVTQNEIRRLSSQKLNSELALLILNSNYLNDQVWTLNQISTEMEISKALQNKLMELIEGNDIYLAERSLNALKPEVVSSEIQMDLAYVFLKSGFLQKRLIIQKLKEVKQINPKAIQLLTAELYDLNGTLTKNLLELYKLHGVNDPFTITTVAKLLKSDNQYIANQALSYLESMDIVDKKTQKTIARFKKRNS